MMRRWGVMVLLAALAGCADDGPVCTPGFREPRRCPGQLALQRCNAAGTGYECDPARECSGYAPCAVLPVCVEHSDPTAEFGTRASCAVACQSSAECGGERSCCVADRVSGRAGCVPPNRSIRCLP